MGARASEHEVKEKRGTLTASHKGMCSWGGRDPFLFLAWANLSSFKPAVFRMCVLPAPPTLPRNKHVLET